jgi:hypothetical protein
MKFKRLNLLMSVNIAVMILLVTPCSQLRAGTDPQVNVYFTVAPIQGSAGFAVWQANFIATMQDTNHPLMPIIYQGAVISATNLFSFYPGNNGKELLTGAHVRMNGSTFSLNQITWILSSQAETFSNTYTGLSFGPGIVGANGGAIYTTGPADNVPLTDLWMDPEALSYAVGQGKTIDQAIVSFINSLGPNLPVTLSCILNGTTNSATVLAQVQPTLIISGQAGSNRITLSWPNFSAFPFVLEQNSDLTKTNWSSAITGIQKTQVVPLVITQTNLTVTNAGGNMFFRLKYP